MRLMILWERVRLVKLHGALSLDTVLVSSLLELSLVLSGSTPRTTSRSSVTLIRPRSVSMVKTLVVVRALSMSIVY